MANACSKCNCFYVRCRCNEILLEVKNERLKDELDEYHNAEKFVLGDDCPTDEVHCGCMVILKKQIKDQNNQIRKLADALALKGINNG